MNSAACGKRGRSLLEDHLTGEGRFQVCGFGPERLDGRVPECASQNRGPLQRPSPRFGEHIETCLQDTGQGLRDGGVVE